MPSFGPRPQGFEDGGVHTIEGLFAHHMSVIVGPAPNHGIELGDHIRRGSLLVGLHDLPDLTQECLDILSGGLDQQFARVLAYVLAQKIEAVLDVREVGFLWGEFQSALA